MISKQHLLLVALNALVLIIFGTIFFARANYEFLGYIGVIILVGILIAISLKKVAYPIGLLYGLSLWGLMHLAGGGIRFADGSILYHQILMPLSDTYGIFRYDQLVHIVGFGFSTWAMYQLIGSYLNVKKGTGLFIVVVMAGLGVGALNEMIEFLATVFVANTNFGGYTNTLLDLFADA